MPTDYACHTAAEQAAQSLAPVCAVLAPDRPASGSEAEVMPVVLRNYLGARPAAPAVPRAGSAPTVRVTTGAAVLRLCLDGLRAEMEGSLALWHTNVIQQLPEVLRQGKGKASKAEWEVLQELQLSAQEVLTQLAGRGRNGASGARMLGGQVALLEDVLCGALRRLSVPAEAAAAGAGGLARAVASLFGLVASPAEH
ncbi:hypothetical protein [Streptomyces sp. DH24]|uniref:hypothetical protein n=1 Tax=Streptomyces sp. DH24 TaxID=3040123 RepID=UPI0024429E86|nr:hypothetical protein [Streptomyces sp. DH24]MDG9715496.1 hypothetical protein [Streptomyces sp. DH24]